MLFNALDGMHAKDKKLWRVQTLTLQILTTIPKLG